MKTENTFKHIAQTIRIVSIAQFAKFGVDAFNDLDLITLYLSILVFIILEAVGAYLINIGENNE
jgi:hypothetical protein